MAICESLILVCTLVGKLCIGKISGSKGSNLELFGDFRQKDEKSTRGPKVNSWSTPTLEHRRVKGRVPRVWHKRIPEDWPRNRKVNFRPGKSTEVNRAHMVNPEVKPEGITQRLMQDFPTSTRRAHLIGGDSLVVSRDSNSKRRQNI